MPPPLKGRALVDELCFRLPTYLQEQLGVLRSQPFFDFFQLLGCRIGVEL